MKTLLVVTLFVSICSVAQTSGPVQESNDVFYRTFDANQQQGAAPPADVFYGRAVSIVSDLRPVTGAPYSATAVTETLQVLADGNRIARKSSTFLARDGQGRTRREEKLGMIGSLALNGPKVAFIHDPVARTNYVLDLQHQTAHALHEDGVAPPLLPSALSNEKRVIIADKSQPNTDRVWVSSAMEGATVKTESLGTQVIEGVTAEGKRTTRTIPAGQIGNERPLEITSEVWTSPDLQVTMLSKRNDPRFGETVYRLTDIKRDEPDRSLFEVPRDFSLESAGPPRQ